MSRTLQNFCCRLGIGGACVWMLVVLCQGSAVAQTWHRFLGEGGDGTSRSKNIPSQWDAEKNLRWKAQLPGFGASSPIVVGDQIFLTCYSGYGTGEQSAGKIEDLVRHLVCIDRNNGQILWTKNVDNSAIADEDPYKSFITQHGYATNTPVSDGETVFVFLGKPGLFAYDLAGNQRWHEKIEYQTNETRWGSAASPILHGDDLILNAVEENGNVVAISKSNGAIRWEYKTDSKLAYATPNMVTTAAGETELVIALPNKVVGLNPDDGKQKWFVTNNFDNESNGAVIVDQDIVYIYGGFRSVGSMAIRAGGQGNVTESHVLWQTRDTSYVSTPVLKNGHLYWISERGIAHCVNAATGQRIYRERVPGVRGGRGIKFFASMVVAGDRLFAVSRRSGTFVMKAQPTFDLISQNKIAGDDSEFNGTPAIHGDQLFVRSNKCLYCIATDQ